MEEIKKLEDMPKYVPIILIKDNSKEDSKARIFGNNPHDNLVLEYNQSKLYYYNSQCGSSSLDIGDFRFVIDNPTCFDDLFYSSWCQMVDLEKLIADHDKKVKKEVVQEIIQELSKIEDTLINLGNGKEDAFNYFIKILDQIQGENNDR